MTKNVKNYDDQLVGGAESSKGPGSITDPTGEGGASKSGGSPKPDPKNQKRTDQGRIRYSGGASGVGGGRSGKIVSTREDRVTNPLVMKRKNTKGGMLDSMGGRTTEAGTFSESDQGKKED